MVEIPSKTYCRKALWSALAGACGALAASSGAAACNFENSTSTPPEAGLPDVVFTFPDAGGIPPSDASVIEASGDAATADVGADAPADVATEALADAACVPSGTAVMHTTDVAADETWTSGIHVVPSGVQIKGGARLTVAPCSEVRLGAGASITATASAAGFDAVGTQAAPIRFVSQQAGTPWGAIDVTAPATSHLAYVTLTGGGTGPHASAPAGGATLAAHGSDPQRPVVLKLEHVTVSGSGGFGVFLRGARFDAASTELTVTGSGWYPVFMGVASATELPSGAYTGNAIDQILLQTYGVAATDDTGPVLTDVTMHDPGIPYRVGISPSSIRVGDGLAGSPAETLTIGSGVTLLFTPQGTGGRSELLVSAASAGSGYAAQGALAVQGTTQSPVVFDSAGASPAAGDWLGLYFSHVIAPQTTISNAHIAHAGGASGSVGICPSTPAGNNGVATCAVILFLDAPPSGSFLTNSLIDSAPCGVYREWAKTDVDFTATNQFTSVPGCVQTSIPDASGACAMCTAGP